MAYLKPQSPIKRGQDYLYPLTTYDQIIMNDGSRWNGQQTNLYVGEEQPEEAKYEIWIDTSSDAAEVMPKNALKYKAFSIAADAWVESGNVYSYTMEAIGITENSAILNLTLDANSQANQTAQLDWESKRDQIILTTSSIPKGTIAGYLIAAEVTVI